MRFRDIRSFNLALLAKQGWMLITNPGTLLHKIYNAKYFPKGDFLSATWRNIIAAGPFLEKGIRYRVGNGASISIWRDPWLEDDGSFKIITTRPASPNCPSKVAELIDTSTHMWDETLIRELVWPIPVGAVDVEDRITWHFSKNGDFSVKSCYHVIFELAKSARSSGAQGSGSGPIVRAVGSRRKLPFMPHCDAGA